MARIIMLTLPYGMAWHTGRTMGFIKKRFPANLHFNKFSFFFA